MRLTGNCKTENYTDPGTQWLRSELLDNSSCEGRDG